MNALWLKSQALAATEMAVKEFTQRTRDTRYYRDFYAWRSSDHEVLESPDFKRMMLHVMSVQDKVLIKKLYMMLSDLDRTGKYAWRNFKRKIAELNLRGSRLHYIEAGTLVTKELILVPLLMRKDGEDWMHVVIFRYKEPEDPGGMEEIYFEDWIRCKRI